MKRITIAPHAITNSSQIMLWVASSTWTTNLLRLDPTFNSDLPESKRWLKEYGARENEAFRKYPVPKTEYERRMALQESTKFLVVRHPLDRLVSSYVDKV